MLNRRQFLHCSAALGLSRLAWAVPPLRLAYFETYSPLSFRGEAGMQGILIELFDELLGKRLGQPLVHQGFPWIRAQSLVQQGEQDAMCTVATPERLAYARAAQESVLDMPIRVFVRANNPRLAELQAVQNLAQLRALDPEVLSYVGNGWAKEKLAGMRVDWGGTFADSLRKLKAGRGEVMVENALTMQYTLKQLDPERRVLMLNNDLERSRFQLLISLRSPHLGLLPAFDEALRHYKREPGYAQLFERYGIRL